MEKKKILKCIITIALIILILGFIYNLNSYIRKGKQKISVLTSSTYYSDSYLSGMLTVSKKKNYDTIPVKAKVKIELVDQNGKKVKHVKKASEVVNKNEKKDFNLELPDDLETGNYYLKITSNSGILKDTIKVPVQIASNSNTETIISFDKGIYKPGDEINFRTLLISKKDNTPIENEIEISIYDGNDNRVYFEKTKTSEYGIVSGKFTLADEVNSGTYKLIVKNGTKESSKSFIVNPYITPKFEVSVTSDKDTYLIGETANITVNSKYFFGEPVVNADVVVKVNNDEEIKGITNNEGNFVTTYLINSDKKYSFDVQVTDSSKYLIESNKTIYGATDKFEIELLPEYGNLVKNVDNNIYLITKSPDGKGIKTVNKINVGNIKRDVITDESGIKYFTLTSRRYR